MPDWTHHDIKTGYVAKPLQQPHPPIAMSGMSPFSGTMKFAGGRGYIPVSANFVGDWVVASHWKAYSQGAEAAGLTPDASQWHVARSIYVADTDAEAEAFVKKDGGAYDFYFKYLFTLFDRGDIKGGFVVNQGDDPEKLSHADLRDSFTIYGSPETVARKILELREKIGPFGTLMYAAHDWLDKDLMKKSICLMAESVMPQVNQVLGTKAAAE